MLGARALVSGACSSAALKRSVGKVSAYKAQVRRAATAATARVRVFHTSGPAWKPEAAKPAAAAAAPAKTEEPPKPPDGHIFVTVDGNQVAIPNGSTVLYACDTAGVEIPRFCYHDRLSIAGNCRMCLVEVEKSPKPVASCAMPAMPNMNIKTNTEQVMKAREGVMEFLLSNHPLDCPICDQGGECDLQDQSMAFGSDRSRFKELKRTVEDKNIGPFIKTIMTRCIHCTRCVRFSEEIAGVEDLGVTGRGNVMEIGTYVEKAFDSELSGNVVDICPVGALTSKPYAFTARPWELSLTETVDVMDAVGCNIRIDTRGAQIMRVLPRLHEDINEEWLSDKSRHAWDGLTRQRLDTPLVKKGESFEAVTWPEALSALQERLAGVQGAQLKAIVGDQVDAESVVAMKDLMNRLGSTNTECRQDGSKVNADLRSDYIFNTSIAGIEEADVVLLVGSNPRMEAPLINARIRKSVTQFGTEVASIGPKANLTYAVDHLGEGGDVVQDILSGKHAFSQKLKNAERAVIILGAAATRRADGAALVEAVRKLALQTPSLIHDGWNGVNVLQLAAARTAALDVGFVPGPDASDKDVKVVFLLGADEYDDAAVPKDAFVIYQGHHGDKGASRADIILPGAAYTEKDGTYVNTEGRPQRTYPAVNRVGEAREDWQIIRALSEVLGTTLPYDNLKQLRERMADIAPHLSQIDTIQSATVVSPGAVAPKDVAKDAFKPSLDNFFFTDPISRNSRTMARATEQLKNAVNSYVQ